MSQERILIYFDCLMSIILCSSACLPTSHSFSCSNWMYKFRNANTNEGKINHYSSFSVNKFHWLFIFPSVSCLMPLEACLELESDADIITQFHHFIGFFILSDVARKEPWTTFFSFLLYFTSFFPSRQVSVEFSWHSFPSLSSHSTSEWK